MSEDRRPETQIVYLFICFLPARHSGGDGGLNCHLLLALRSFSVEGIRRT